MTDPGANGSLPRSLTPAQRLARIAWILVSSVLALKGAILVVFSLTSRYVMDELTQAGYSLYIPAGFYKGFHDAKTVLYVYYFDLARLLTHDSVHLMRAARIEGLLLGLGMALFVFRIVRNLGFGRLEAATAVVVLSSFSTFMEQCFRVRSDVCAVFFSASALWWATRKHPRRAPRDFVTGALAAAAFLCTQKAAYVVVAIGAALVASRIRERDLRPFLRGALMAAAGFWASVILYALYFRGLHFLSVIREIIQAPLQTPSIHGQTLYPGMRRYLWIMLGRNALPLAICGVGLALALARWRHLRENERFALAFTIVVVAAYFSYEQPWPYVLLWPLPALALFVPFALELVGRPASTFAATAPLAVALLAALSFPRNFHYLALSNGEQEQTMNAAESLLRPTDRYADGLWMLPTRFHAGMQWWAAFELKRIIAALDRGDSRDIREVFEAQPKVWITNYRVNALWPALRPRLEHSYVPVYPGVLLTGVMLSNSAPVAFQNWWRGPYSLHDSSGRGIDAPLTIDGHRIRGTVELGVGKFMVSCPLAKAGHSVFLLPSSADLTGPLPATVWNGDLFSGVYDF